MTKGLNVDAARVVGPAAQKNQSAVASKTFFPEKS